MDPYYHLPNTKDPLLRKFTIKALCGPFQEKADGYPDLYMAARQNDYLDLRYKLQVIGKDVDPSRLCSNKKERVIPKSNIVNTGLGYFQFRHFQSSEE
ncbi:hypothetical protein AVEN_104880-1 [Araneus ventricosus]|uniref:Uncharacterized protein n=1 Tax=Araneus ventricosus TaxID=182803 RepID=A0A4Y2FFE7_ARAVE|nr:hypothetical protein AVEN_104880-1 [Araneus ventricosus]